MLLQMKLNPGNLLISYGRTQYLSDFWGRVRDKGQTQGHGENKADIILF